MRNGIKDTIFWIEIVAFEVFQSFINSCKLFYSIDKLSESFGFQINERYTQYYEMFNLFEFSQDFILLIYAFICKIQ